MKQFLAILALTTFCIYSEARDVKCYITEDCGSSGSSSGAGRSSPNPSTGDTIKINPSAIPLEKGWGVESIFYKDTPDFALVTGTGRVGAAIAPSNSEETFFGAPSFENASDFLARNQAGDKYKSQKVALAGAFLIAGTKQSSLKRFSLKMGLLAKYNTETHNTNPGAGLSAIVGPFTLGYSIYKDETYVKNGYTAPQEQTIKYQVHTYNAGIYLNSLILDYSNLTIEDPYKSNVQLFTGSLFLKSFILTAAKRIEKSDRPYYNPDTKNLEFK